MSKVATGFNIIELVKSDVVSWTDYDIHRLANLFGSDRYTAALFDPAMLSVTEREYEAFFEVLGTRRLLQARSTLKPQLRSRAEAWLEWKHKEEVLRLARSGKNASWCGFWLAVIGILLTVP